MPFRFNNLGRGKVQKQAVSNSNIFEGMVTRNMTEPTYTTAVNGTAVSLNPGARTITGFMPVNGDTPTFSGRQPKGMTLRTQQGPQTVHVNPYN